MTLSVTFAPQGDAPCQRDLAGPGFRGRRGDEICHTDWKCHSILPGAAPAGERRKGA